ncbi:unnamed protein product [Camellia sinensis]
METAIFASSQYSPLPTPSTSQSLHFMPYVFTRNTLKSKPLVTLLDYGAGNVPSVRNENPISRFRRQRSVQTPEDILNAKRLIVPGVGAFAAAMDVLTQKVYQGKGFHKDLIKLISDAVNIPVIASSGAGAV